MLSYEEHVSRPSIENKYNMGVVNKEIKRNDRKASTVIAVEKSSFGECSQVWQIVTAVVPKLGISK